MFLVNRGNRNKELPGNVRTIIADINDEAIVAEKIKDLDFDVVCDFSGFVPEQLQRDYRLFRGKEREDCGKDCWEGVRGGLLSIGC